MEEEKILHNATICFFIKEEQVCLGMKTQKIGKDCWNGYGGGIEKDESPEYSAVRELDEEAKIKTSVDHLEKVAVVDFHNTMSDSNTFTCRCHIFFVNKWEGEIQETKEMITPTWFDFNKLPLDKMMPSDRVWLPIILSGKKIIAQAHLSPFQKELLGEVTIGYVDNF